MRSVDVSTPAASRPVDAAFSSSAAPAAPAAAPSHGLSVGRRDFLQMSGLLGGLGLAAWPAGLYAAGADEKPRVGLVGCGWYGKTDLLHLIQVAPVEVVGLCDVDRRMRDEAAQLVAKRQVSKEVPPTYGDYRQLLADQQPEIVLVATPDHWHCLPMIAAVQAGADVYVQKPISWDVVEGQAMVAAARKYRRTVQVGLQRRSTAHLLEARDRYIDSGRLGRIGYVDIHSYYGGPAEFAAAEPAPEWLDWEMYVGPAPWRDYQPGIHPRQWRAARQFSNGQTGDLCVHLFDLVRYFLGLGWPKQIAASGGRLMRPAESTIDTHDTQTALFDYGQTQVVWTQRNWGENPDPDYPWGATLYGEHGTLKLSVWSYDFVPRGGGPSERGEAVDQRSEYPEDVEHPETEWFAAAATRRHMRDFLEARRTGRLPVSDIYQGHVSSACCILANLSMELGRGLRWDSDREQAIDDEAANQRLAREYRGDWIHPTPENV